MGKQLRAKMFVSSVTRHINEKGAVEAETLELYVVTDGSPEDKAWSLAPPSANLKMYITNPDAFGTFPRGARVFVNLTPAD